MCMLYRESSVFVLCVGALCVLCTSNDNYLLMDSCVAVNHHIRRNVRGRKFEVLFGFLAL